MGEYRLIHGDCLVELCNLPANSVDAIVTDPPYELGFMGKSWDSTGVAFSPETWTACLRVLKPGGHMLCFGGSRTFHRIACAIEDAGFELRDTIMWAYGSGFPKSHNLQGQWQGWGTALKPAYEPIILARRPLEGTVAANVLKWGTGAINIDGCRVGAEQISVHNAPKGTFAGGMPDRGSDTASYRTHQGRFPANFIHDGSEEVLELFPTTSPTKPHGGDEKPLDTRDMGWGFKRMPSTLEDDGGSAARYFYCAKTSKQDRDEGCEGLEEKQYSHDGRETTIENAYQRNNSKAHNHHPTVKPTSLMRYLCRLITPPNGTILDPFMGSGSTGKAALLEGFNFIGIEREQEYVEIAEARIGATTGASVAVIEEQSQIPGQLTLF